MLLLQRCFALWYCAYIFIDVKSGAAASIFQALKETSADLKDGYFNVKYSYLSEINCNRSENGGKENILQKLKSVDLPDVSEKEVFQPKNATYLTQMFHISRSIRGKRNAVDLMMSKNRRHRKQKKVPGMNKLDAGKSDLRTRRKKIKKKRKTFVIPLPFPNEDRDRDNGTTVADTNSNDVRPVGRKSKRKRHKLTMPLPFPNAESSEVHEINNVTVNDSLLPDEVLKSSSVNLKNSSSSIGIKVNEGGQLVVTADKDTVDGNVKLPVKRVKRHKVKRVKIPLPFNSVPKVLFKEAKRENEKEIVVIRTKRHRKRKRKRFSPLN